MGTSKRKAKQRAPTGPGPASSGPGPEQITEEQLRAIFDQVIAGHQDPSRVAQLQVLRAFYTDWTFRAQLQLLTWQINNHPDAFRAQLESIRF